MSIPPTIAFIRWRRALRANGSLPAEAEVKRVRKLVMAQAHIIPIVPLAAVFLARGYGS
jgi:putative membrane protein